MEGLKLCWIQGWTETSTYGLVDMDPSNLGKPLPLPLPSDLEKGSRHMQPAMHL